jgi:hypothetical protein
VCRCSARIALCMEYKTFIGCPELRRLRVVPAANSTTSSVAEMGEELVGLLQGKAKHGPQKVYFDIYIH